MLDQRAALVELGKADRNTAAYGCVAVMGGMRAQEQLLLATCLPGEQLCPLQGHQGSIAAGQAQADGGQAMPCISAGAGSLHGRR